MPGSLISSLTGSAQILDSQYWKLIMVLRLVERYDEGKLTLEECKARLSEWKHLENSDAAPNRGCNADF